jgi:sugar/nucleoside kinase (ribokinase family)
MWELDHQFQRAANYLNSNSDFVRSRETQRLTKENNSSSILQTSEESNSPTPIIDNCWIIPSASSIVCAGLACVDMQLLCATSGNGTEAIETFSGEKTTGGGSVSMACKNLSRMTHGTHHAVFHQVIPICKIGCDNAGDKLLQLFHTAGLHNHNLDTHFIERARTLNPGNRTALAVLPIYQDGTRGCFFDSASNKTFSASEMIQLIDEINLDQQDGRELELGAFLFGYPHLLPKMQGQALYDILFKARSSMKDGGLVVVDVNGLPKQNPGTVVLSNVIEDTVLGPALRLIDILHLNEDELQNLTGLVLTRETEEKDSEILHHAADLILKCGVAIILVTRGARGSFVKCNNQSRFDQSRKLCVL